MDMMKWDMGGAGRRGRGRHRGTLRPGRSADAGLGAVGLELLQHPVHLGVVEQDGRAESQRRAVLGRQRIDLPGQEIGRASCRERVCQYVSISVVAVSLKTQNQNNRTYPRLKHRKTTI